MARIVAGTEFRVVIQWRNGVQESGRVVEAVVSGDRAQITKMIEVNEVDEGSGIERRSSSGESLQDLAERDMSVSSQFTRHADQEDRMVGRHR